MTAPFFLMIACAHKQEVKVAEAPPAKPAAPATPQKAEVTDASSKTSGTTERASCEQVRVHFAFNSEILRDEDRPVLQQAAQCLTKNEHVRVVIEGNADERGTEEYNLALGDRRARSVEKYLGTLGVSEKQMNTISYGKEQPLCNEHDEACWAKNRSAAVKPSAS